jgi:hypothetical protein
LAVTLLKRSLEHALTTRLLGTLRAPDAASPTCAEAMTVTAVLASGARAAVTESSARQGRHASHKDIHDQVSSLLSKEVTGDLPM